MSKKRIDFQVITEKIKNCCRENNIVYEELLVTPLRDSYKIEVIPEPTVNKILELAQCISKSLNAETIIREYLYGQALIIKT